MKKLLACILAGAMALCLGACGSSKEVTAETDAVILANEALEAAENAELGMTETESGQAETEIEAAETETELAEAETEIEETESEPVEAELETAEAEIEEAEAETELSKDVNEGAVLAGGSAGTEVISVIDDYEETEEIAESGDIAEEAGIAEADDNIIEVTTEGEISTDKILLDDMSEEEAEEETARIEEIEAEDLPDVSQAVDGSTTSEEEPAPFGAWVETALYATQDSTYHTAYVRIVKVTTESDDPVYVESAIEANNGYGDESDFIDPEEMEIQDDAEIVVMDYEVFVPLDFPAPSYGITEPKIYFSMRNIGGGGIPSLDGSTAYIGMGTTEDMVVRASSESYTPGHTYGERCIYTMVIGYTGYVASYSSYPDGTSSDETSSENMYTVYHSIN